MGIFGWVKGLIFRKKKEEPPPEEGPEDLGPLTPLKEEREGLTPTREPLPPRGPLPSIEPMAPPRVEPERGVEASNLKAKMDLLLTKMENISIQNRTIDERLKAIEKTLAEMRGIRYY